MIAAGLAALMTAVTPFLGSFTDFAAGFASSLVIMNVVCFFFCFLVTLSLSSFSSVAIGLSGIRATPWLLASAVGGALAGGFFWLSLSEGAFLVHVVESLVWVLLVALSGVGGGVGCSRCVGWILVSGVMAVDGIAAAFGVGGSAKDSFVCRTTFVSVSFAVVTLVCFVSSSWRRLVAACSVRAASFLGLHHGRFLS